MKRDYYRAAKCPVCGRTMDKVTAWVCSHCGGKVELHNKSTEA